LVWSRKDSSRKTEIIEFP